ncbi:MAG TPA: hypothetical protein VG755_06810, partial [Nannocystaceae bacterium]|nr:hypothetical protein [Nannocystaceae bacterium]
DFGLLAVANIAARLDPARLPEGPQLVVVAADDDEQLAKLRAPESAHLCTVSHVSAVHRGRRFHHHMMIVLGTAQGDAYDVFDTTGSRGVAVERMSVGRLHTYVRGLLAANRDYRYAPASARLTCVRVLLRVDE